MSTLFGRKLVGLAVIIGRNNHSPTSIPVLSWNSLIRHKGTNAKTEYERIPPHHEKNDDIVTQEILNASLNYVNTCGWNRQAIRAGAQDVFLSEEISGIFNDYDLVKFFFSKCNNELEDYLSSTDPLPTMLEGLEFRLEKVIPYSPKFQEALALATKPENLSESLRFLLQLSDSIAHHALKDRSTDVNWYTKRMGIASIYAATELCLVQDTSEKKKETFEFLARRVKDFDDLGHGNISFLGDVPLTRAMGSAFTTLCNILGQNAPR